MCSAAHICRVRIATPRDNKALVQLCRAAVGPGDYVLTYLRGMIAAREILVAEERGGRIVAMLGVAVCLDRALWLGQARTHPDFRRRGYAQRLVEAARRRAQKERRPALRLWTSERNKSAQRLAESTGFRRIAVFTRRVARTLRTPSGLHTTRRAVDALRLWRESEFSRRGGGYIAYHWHFLPLTPRMGQKLATRNELLVGPHAAMVLWSEEEERTASASMLAGSRKGLLAARRAAGERGYSAVQTSLPRDPRIARWAREAGFVRGSWGTRAVLYERRI